MSSAEQAEAQPEQLPDAPSAESASVRDLPKRVLKDEVHIVQFPRFLQRRDLVWGLPLAAATVASFATDERVQSGVVSTNPSFQQTSSNVSDGLRDGFIAAPIALLGAGLLRKDDHAREAGVLGSEAMIDAYVVGAVVKLATFRERPMVDRAEGSFFRTAAGTDSSFISGHSLTAWSSAAAIAAEYPNRWTAVGVYTLATGVSVTRVLAQQHFPSDVLLGSAAGWFIGHYVVRAHQRHAFRR